VFTLFIYIYFAMRVHSLLIALTISTFTISTVLPWVVMAQGVTATIDENGVLTLAGAQQAAAKITVRIRVGQGGGSGVLLAKKGNTYLVLTNAHVVQEQTAVNITTPDGQVHTAQQVRNAQVGDFDLALLEFNSTHAYDLAKLDNFKMAASARLREKHTVLAAGFPYNANGLKLLEGAITQLPHEAFRNGTQVGYVTKEDLVQGMSGGPILNSFGDLVGINSTLARPVIDNYVYADGSKAPRNKVEEYRQANWSVPIYNLLTRLNPDVLYSYKQLPKLQRAVTPTGYMAELDRKARAVTVRIEKNNGANGSGVIIARDGNTYSVLTADHVVKNSTKITTYDQQTYKISPSDIKRLVGADLAVIKFTSSQTYQVANLGNYKLSDNSLVFVGGWPDPRNINTQQWQWQINLGSTDNQDLGELKTKDKQSFSNGYDLVYTSVTHGGMSGGPVFDTAGQVIGIHGRAEGVGRNIVGNSLGISIKTFLGLANQLGVDVKKMQLKKTAPNILNESQLKSVNLARNNISIPINKTDATQWISYGNSLYRLKKYPDAIKAFGQAVALKADSIDDQIAALYGKGFALAYNGDNLGALEVCDQAISLIPSQKEAQYYYIWKYRSILLFRLKKYPEALLAVSKAINLDKQNKKVENQDFLLVNTQAFILFNLNRSSEAIKIYDDIIDRDKKVWAYFNRGTIKLQQLLKSQQILKLQQVIQFR
jgi:S1-C subfamily serine protease